VSDESSAPTRGSLPTLKIRVRECRACGLWQQATQAVFGDGPEDAKVMLVGEQPGDAEDRAGLRGGSRRRPLRD
jgi:DNA polymerase